MPATDRRHEVLDALGRAIAGGGIAHAPDPAAQAERLAGMAHSREANR